MCSSNDKRTRIPYGKRPMHNGYMMIMFVVSVIFVFIARVLTWARVAWGNLTMNEIVFTLTSPLEGTSEGVWHEIALFCLPWIAVVCGIFIFLLLKGSMRNKQVITRITFFLSSLLLVTNIVLCWHVFKVGSYMKGILFPSTFIEKNYVDPADVDIEFPDHPRNLVYIYLESIEATFADKQVGGAFEQNIIPNLTNLGLKSESFAGDAGTLNGGVSLYNTTWTMAGMFAQTAALPLTSSIGKNDMEFQQSFAPAVTTLGDILQQHGYTNAFLLGSICDFGGRKLYFTTHGNYEIYDYLYSKVQGEIPSDYRVWWGYEDDKLFDLAKKHVEELSSSSEPFNLTILTVDTHREDGYVCADCPTTFGDNQYANVIACSDKKTCDFIAWLQEQPCYENTTVILCGDHITMDSDFCASVDDDYNRRVYTAIINAPVSPKTNKTREYSTMDMLPTTLAALGVQIDGDRLGLGTNLYAAKETLVEQYGKDEVNEQLQSRSTLMEKLISVDKSREPRVSVKRLDDDEGSYQLRLTGVEFGSDISEVSFIVIRSDGSDSAGVIQVFGAKLESDGSYTATISISDLAEGAGSYSVQPQKIYTDGSSQPMQQTIVADFS